MASNGLNYAYKLLSSKDFFKDELYKKIDKKFGYEEAERVVAYLEELGYINDEKVAYNYIRYKLKSGYGPYYISNKLYLKGYHKDISFIEEVAEKENIDMDEYILRYSKRYIKENSDEPYKDYIKCINFLKNKGYSHNRIMNIVKKEDFLV